MQPTPENPELVAVRGFPRRLLLAKQHLHVTKEAEVSWAWIAERTGHSTSVMSQIKTGERSPSLEEVVVFAALCGVRPEWLAFESGGMLGGNDRPTEDQERRTTVVNSVTSARPGRKQRPA